MLNETGRERLERGGVERFAHVLMAAKTASTHLQLRHSQDDLPRNKQLE